MESVELVRSHEVHPYHLLGAQHIFLTQAAAAKLSETLAKSVAVNRKAPGKEARQ
jgi:hypothetical protein